MILCGFWKKSKRAHSAKEQKEKYNYMDTSEELIICYSVISKAKKIAERWIKGLQRCTPGISSSPSNIRLDFERRVITFVVNPTSSGLGSTHTISFGYLTGLFADVEGDAEKYYREDEKQRIAACKYKSDLENDPKVKEYIQMNGPNCQWNYYPGSYDKTISFLK